VIGLTQYFREKLECNMENNLNKLQRYDLSNIQTLDLTGI